MKKLNLLLITVLFSSLLIACGMKGPLYRAQKTQTIEKQQTTLEEQNKEMLEDKNNTSSLTL